MTSQASPRRAALVLLGGLSAALAIGMLPAFAAELPACPDKGKPATTTTCVISWDGRDFDPAETRIRTGVPIRFSNFGDAVVDGDVTISWNSGGKTVEVVVERGPEPSDPVVLSGSGTVKITGDDRSLGNGEGKILLVAPPSPSPPPDDKPSVKPTSNTKKPKPDGNGDGKSDPSPTPKPSAAAAGQGVTNPPPLGIPEVSPGSTPAPGLPPVVALPGTTPTPGASPAPTGPVGGATLAQPVEARKIGMPGALAGVLLVGVVAGVYRLARVEYGAPHIDAVVPNSTEPDESV